MLPRALIQTSKPAEFEPLNGAHWRMMVMPLAFNQFKQRAEYFTERSGIVPNNGQPAATFRTIQSECADDNMTAGAHGP
jgi:hypothetical protein